MWTIHIFLLVKGFSLVNSAYVRCGNTTYPVLSDIHHNEDSSGIMVTWDLLSPSEICSDPPRLPKFVNRRLYEVAVIASCPQCPKCTVRLPEKYQLPVGTSITTLYILTKQVPNYKFYTDIDVRYVLVDRLPKSLRNCEIIFRERPPKEEFSLEKTIMFICVFISVFLCVCGARCCFAKLI